MAKSNIIEFPMDRVRSFTTTTVVDETGPFTWYSTPGQTETLEEDYVTGLEWICIQSKELDMGIVARAEYTFTEFDDISVTTTSNGSASVKKTASGELTTMTVSLSKSF